MESPMPHDDAAQDKEQTLDLIKQTLMKVIEDMNQMESDRFMPDARKPKPVVEAKIEAKPEDEMPMDDSEEDPEMLSSLMSKADEADEDGSLPEDAENDLPPEIMDAVKKHKKEMA